MFNLDSSTAASEFRGRVHVGITVYIPHRIYRLKSYLHEFQLLVLLPYLMEMTYFLCTNRINLVSKGKFRQTSDRCKRVLEATKLNYANQRKESIIC